MGRTAYEIGNFDDEIDTISCENGSFTDVTGNTVGEIDSFADVNDGNAGEIGNFKIVIVNLAQRVKRVLKLFWFSPD